MLTYLNTKIFIIIIVLFLIANVTNAEDGHQLWLRSQSANQVNIICSLNSAVINIVRQELIQGWHGNSGATISLMIGSNPSIKNDGFKLTAECVEANTELGILYGVYELLRRQRTGQLALNEISNPSYQRRILNHWDNLDGTIERGYAGHSIFWRVGIDSIAITEKDKKLWNEYARANASIGLNGAVLNNVNATPKILTNEYLRRVKAISVVLRPYGIKIYLAINFSSPAIIGGLKTSDPLNSDVIQWWKNKVKEIYSLIPDFGGFLVKANSEGQPGPQDFGRTHVDGANMLADALKSYGGIVMWRAFVYSPKEKDRARQAYMEFMPLDAQFRENVIIQVKNGPVDFQPREPFSPLFGAMKKTSIMPELQITQEYLGQSIQLVFLSPMWEEFLNSETYQKGVGSTVARCTDGSVILQKYTAIAGVANIGLDTNWCGHHFSQANWYTFGRLAWNNKLKSERIADEWLQLTFSSPEARLPVISNRKVWQDSFLVPIKEIMLQSHETAVDNMMPLGLHHIFAAHHHYGPGPWWAPKDVRSDWTPPYYHQADTNGIGFDRTRNGSNAVRQYHSPLDSLFNDLESCPEMYLLWFHHLPWDYTLKSGRILWDELCYHYDSGLQQVRHFQKTWEKVQPYVDEQRFFEIQSKLRRHCQDGQIWKDACLLYFQQFSRRPIPHDIERPAYDLEYLKNLDLNSEKR